ncbi:hypothetical protein ACMDCT_15860 [Halomonadaceae bacterium KBTZ08]
MEHVLSAHASKVTTAATAIALFMSAWTIPANAQDQYHTGFGATLGHQGCSEVPRLVSTFHSTAENLSKANEKITSSEQSDRVLQDYLNANLKLNELPRDSAEYKVLSRMSELIMDGEDLSTVQKQTREVCEREFGSP